MNKFVLLKYLIISSFLLFSLTIFSQDEEEEVVAVSYTHLRAHETG